jgi:endoribonuclease LACTB2
MKGPDPHRIRPASAIILRPQGAPRSAYLVERRPDLTFFGGYFAFPGGACDPGDEKIPAMDLPAGSDERRFVGAAARELFEETGILATGSARRGEAAGAARASDDGIEGDEARRFRAQLLATPPADAPRSFHAMLDGARLSIDASRFTPVCRLTTPPFSLVRFETTFFLADLSPGESPSIVPGELVSGGFFDAAEALARWREGEMLIVPPAIILLQMLCDAPGADPTAAFVTAARRLTAEYARGKIQQVFFSPGVRLIALETETRPPARHTNAYLVGEEHLFLVDPGATRADEQARLFEALDDATAVGGGRVAAVLLTHHHPDHVGAVAAVTERLRAPVWAHAETAAKLAGRIEVGRHLDDGDAIPLGTSPDGRPGWQLRVFHTPGHARGHLAFAESRYGALIAGDMISTLSTIVIAPPEGHLATYLASLRKLRQLPNGTLYPAHGPPRRDAHAAIDGYLRHRALRESKILSALAAHGESAGEATGARRASRDADDDRVRALDFETILGRAYDDVKDEALPLARLALRAGLEKLVEEGRVIENGDGYALASPQ